MVHKPPVCQVAYDFGAEVAVYLHLGNVVRCRCLHLGNVTGIKANGRENFPAIPSTLEDVFD